MAHECDDCGETFETLSRLRLHECSDTESILPSDDSVETGGLTDEIGEHLDRVDDGDVTAVHNAVAAFETALSEAVDVDDGGETHREVFWPYYERVANALDDVTQSAGWTLTETARRDFDALDDHARDRIATKLDEIVTDEWREPQSTSNRFRAHRTRNSGSVRSDSAVVLTEPNA